MGQQSPIKDLGPCAVVWSDTPADAPIGETLGDTIFKYSSDYVEIKEDRYGNTAVDGIFTGSSCSVEVPFTRLSLAELAVALPGAPGSGTTGSQIMIKDLTGQPMYENALTLTLKPIIATETSTDSTEWLTIFRAHPLADMEITFNVEGQRVYKVTYMGFRVQIEGQPAGTIAGAMWKIGSI